MPSPVEQPAPPTGPVNMIVKGRGRLYDSLVSDGGGRDRRKEEELKGTKRSAPSGPLAGTFLTLCISMISHTDVGLAANRSISSWSS